MAIVVYIESENGVIKKSGLEAASYGRAIADSTGIPLIAVTFNQTESEVLGDYGVDKIINVSDNNLKEFSADHYSETLANIIKREEARVVVISASINGRYLGPILAIKSKAAYLSNVVALPTKSAPLTVKCSCFTNKAFNHSTALSDRAILSLSLNAFGLRKKKTSPVTETVAATQAEDSLTVNKVEKSADKITIADANIVVSGGRGLKGPDNWHLVENLADVLGAATACSKPVSDMGWRPHSEHVGQTGKPVAANLYIAIGISGAIQHLAGINASKVKVVINNDPEAPFFKAADYGIVGDAFEVVPELTEKLKALK